MTSLLHVLSYVFMLAPSAVLGVQAIQGEAASGATKKQMATDALTIALGSVSPLLSSENQTVANIVAGAVSASINAAVVLTKGTGQYQAATAVAAQSQKDAAAAAAASASAQTQPIPAVEPAAATA